MFIWPTSDADIPETPELKLLVLREPDDALIGTMLKRKGAVPRVHCNTLFFLVAQEGERIPLDTVMRRRLGYGVIADDRTV